MPEMLFLTNSRINKQIAIYILLAILLANFGILQSLGINLATLKLGSWTYLQILQTIGIAWVAYGLWKNQLG